MLDDLRVCSRVCFFAHYDSDSLVDPYVFHYLEELRAIGFTIVFSTTAALDTPTQNELSKLCHDILVRSNEGLDFGSWAAAFSKYGDQLAGDLLLANDSVYGPIQGLGRLVDGLLAKEADFYGLVESLDTAPHLQSWFMLFRPRVHQSQEFRSILGLPFADLSKQEIIETAEIGLTPRLCEAGFRYEAAFPAAKLGEPFNSHPINPSHYFWREMVEQGIPFIKIELLRDNPVHISNIHQWSSIVGRSNPMLARTIDAHLRRKKAIVLSERSASDRILGGFSFDRFVARDYSFATNGRSLAARTNAFVFRVLQRRLKRAFS